MANSLTTKYKYIDTTTGAAATNLMNLAGIWWTSYSGTGQDIAADDDFTMTDTAGNVIMRKRAEAVGDGLEVSYSYPGLKVDGFIVSEMDGGICIIHTY